MTEYLIDPQNHTGYAKAIEEHVDGTLARSYAIGHQIISQSNFTGSPATHFFIHDGHGSTRALVSAVGTVVQRYAYDAHGETLSGTGLTTATSAHTTWLFAGDGQYDRANGLTNHIARWRQGHRFLSLDPYAGNTSDPISLHKYLYGQGNPVLYSDPSGLFGLVDATAGFSIANSLRMLDTEKNALAFDMADSLITGSQAGHSGGRIFGRFLLNNASTIVIGGVFASKWIRDFIAPRGTVDLFQTLRGRNLSDLSNREVGHIGEDIARRYLGETGFTDIVSVQNQSNHGIDIVARAVDGRLVFFEVKSSRVGKIPTPSPRQQSMIGFVQDVLEKASRGAGRYQHLDAVTQDTAQRLRREFQQDPLNVSGKIVGVDLLNENMYLLPWR